MNASFLFLVSVVVRSFSHFVVYFRGFLRKSPCEIAGWCFWTLYERQRIGAMLLFVNRNSAKSIWFWRMDIFVICVRERELL